VRSVLSTQEELFNIFRSGLGLRLVDSTLVPGKAIEQLILETISVHMKGKKWSGMVAMGLRRGKSRLANLTTFYNEVISLVDFVQAMDCIHLDLHKAFDAASYNILRQSDKIQVR